VELTALIQEMGKQAFRAGTAMGRIKEPDMIGDFIASQWFLWDAQSSLEQPAEGVAVGQTWRSQLPVPTPMVMRQARNVVYKLDEVRQGADGSLAVITSTYTPADSVPTGWPIPYSGRFQMSGIRLPRRMKYWLEGVELFDSAPAKNGRRCAAVKATAAAGPRPTRTLIDQTLTMERQDMNNGIVER
jgi:hypothetical protein